MKPSILITGANGLLGQFLVKVLVEGGWPVVATGKGPSRLFFPEDLHLSAEGQAPAYIYADLDFTNAAQVHAVLQRWKPGVIIHAGAMTQVDPCEQDPETCYHVNVHGTQCMLEGASAVGARFVFISTDFIFDGAAGPYREDDAPGPLSVYGHSKWTAEKLIMEGTSPGWAIVRTVLVYGTPLSGTRSNIITWARTNLEAGRPLQVVCDQWRTPTYVEDLARGIEALIRLERGGVYHISGRDLLTPFDMALRTARLLDLDETLLTKVDAASFVQPGRRPARTGFIIDKAIRDLGYDPVSFDEGIVLTLGLGKDRDATLGLP